MRRSPAVVESPASAAPTEDQLAGKNDARSSLLIPSAALRPALRALDRLAVTLIQFGVTANAVTWSCLCVAAIASVLLSYGHFGLASVAMALASAGDAVDGQIARRTRSESVGGALLDASIDRYEEFLFMTGLAIDLRSSVPALLLVLGALVGSFMVSYGSAKAEGLAMTVPPSTMRRAERAVCLCLGVAGAGVSGWLVQHRVVPDWTARAPLFAALAIIAVVANVSAIRRLRGLSNPAPPRKADEGYFFPKNSRAAGS